MLIFSPLALIYTPFDPWILHPLLTAVFIAGVALSLLIYQAGYEEGERQAEQENTAIAWSIVGDVALAMQQDNHELPRATQDRQTGPLLSKVGSHAPRQF